MDKTINQYIKQILEETIKKNNNKYCLISEKRKNLGCYKNKKSDKKSEEELDEMSTAVGLVGAIGKRYREDDSDE